MESDHFMCTGSMHVHDHNVTPCKPGHLMTQGYEQSRVTSL
mgnify:CR=1 FL=1